MNSVFKNEYDFGPAGDESSSLVDSAGGTTLVTTSNSTTIVEHPRHEQTLLLVMYMGLEDVEPKTAHDALNRISEQLQSAGVHYNERWIVIPDYTTKQTHVELLNPTKLEEEKFNKAIEHFDKLEARINSWVILDPNAPVKFVIGDEDEIKIREEEV